MNKCRYILIMIIFAVLLSSSILLSSCGNSDEPDGIDSVSYISDMSGDNPNIPVDSSEESISVLGGNILAEYCGAEYSSSLYLLFMKSALDNLLLRYNVSPEDVPEIDVLLADGSVLTGKEYCEQYAKNEFEWVCLLCSEFESGSKDLSESENYLSALAKANDDYKDNTALYSSLGIGLKDLILFYIYTDLYNEDFFIYYAPGSDNAIPEEELAALMQNDIRKIYYTYLPLYNKITNKDYTNAEKSEMIGISKEYLKRYNHGEDYTVIAEDNFRLLDTIGLSYDPDRLYFYYPVSDPTPPLSISDKAETLEDNEAALLITDDFVSVVIRLPVNGTKDDEWYSYALGRAFMSKYGDEYAEAISNMYDSLDLEYDEEILKHLTLENYIASVYLSE